MFELKRLSPEGVPAALEKANRYRMLNEPEQAESICLDILGAEPDNQAALITLLLSLTDQFGGSRPESPARARELLSRLDGEYEQAYYAGLISERLALARLRSGLPNAGAVAFHYFREAMAHFERAEAIRPPANDDALLRWNSCARMIMAHADVCPEPMAEAETALMGD